MPNWCKNNLKIVWNGEKVLELLELLKDDNGEMTFTKFMPTPKELDDMQAPTPDTVTEEEKKRLMEQYGATDWYSWRIQNWGCKWDATESGFWKDGDDWYVSFQTPWGPPIEFMKALSKKFNNMEFVMQYADEGLGQPPLGEATFKDGEVEFDGPDEAGDGNCEEMADQVWDENWVDNWKGGDM